MVSILSLWAPILVAAVLVFVMSSVIHMVFGYHASDYSKLPDEDGVMDSLRAANIPPGDYVTPFAGSSKAMNTDEYREKVEKGPVAFFTVLDSSAMLNMGAQFGQWFAYAVMVGVVTAYVAGRTLAPGEEYLTVFRLTGTVAFCCYAMAHPQRSIWFKQNWAASGKYVLDGLFYGLLTAGAFGWLWPM